MAWTDAARAAAKAKRAGKGLKSSAKKVGIKTGTKKKIVSLSDLKTALQSSLGRSIYAATSGGYAGPGVYEASKSNLGKGRGTVRTLGKKY